MATTNQEYQCPECGAAALPPAIHPTERRFCTKCGSYFAPTATTNYRKEC